METLGISATNPGRRLARPVFDLDGILLFPPGQVLTEKHLEIMRENGITTVVLLPESDDRGKGKHPVPGFPEPAGPERGQNQNRQTTPVVYHSAASAPARSPEEESLEASIHDATTERFQLLNIEEPHVRILFDMAIERQMKIAMNKGGKLPIGLQKPPDPPKVECPPRISMNRLLETSHRMGTLPVIFHRLIEMINKTVVSSEELAKVIATDSAMTAKLLKLVNSPFVGLPYKIDSISRAVIIVGTKQLVMLAMGATLVSAFKGLTSSHVNMQSYWMHSLSCGAACRLLCTLRDVRNAESYFVAGLLHDIARLLIYAQLPNHSLYIISEARRRNVTLREMEHEALGYTHDELGAELLNVWNCPADLVQRVFKHHKRLHENCSVEDAILPTANTLTQAIGYGGSGERFLPALPDFAWEKTGLNIDNIHGYCNELDANVLSLMEMFSYS
ncbi:MAG: HDOD domain-containing protein [Desulfovibrio sp.]|jgi:HD-like signal output (HDOD) protein|nr:HDOD domain-containing protein [Desulfovibrio sp.]